MNTFTLYIRLWNDINNLHDYNAKLNKNKSHSYKMKMKLNKWNKPCIELVAEQHRKELLQWQWFDCSSLVGYTLKQTKTHKKSQPNNNPKQTKAYKNSITIKQNQQASFLSSYWLEVFLSFYPCMLLCKEAHNMAADFSRPTKWKRNRDHPSLKPMFFYNLILKMTTYNLDHILFIRRKSPVTVHTKGQGNTQRVHQ